MLFTEKDIKEIFFIKEKFSLNLDAAIEKFAKFYGKELRPFKERELPLILADICALTNVNPKDVIHSGKRATRVIVNVREYFTNYILTRYDCQKFDVFLFLEYSNHSSITVLEKQFIMHFNTKKEYKEKYLEIEKVLDEKWG